MIIVGMDTSSVNATVAVMNENKLIGEYLISNDRTHSQIIMPLLEDLLKKCGVRISDADVFATAIGPGSFTGVPTYSLLQILQASRLLQITVHLYQAI